MGQARVGVRVRVGARVNTVRVRVRTVRKEGAPRCCCLVSAGGLGMAEP